MKKLNMKLLIGMLITAFTLGLAGPMNTYAATSPTLGAVGSYSVLAGSIVTNTGATTMPGNLGVSPSIGVPPHVTGFPLGIVGPPGAIHDADADAASAQADNTAAFLALSAAPNVTCTTDYSGTGPKDLTTISPLVPGIYCADSFTLTGNLTLTGSSGVWIFRSAATIITSPNSSVTGGDPCNVWWKAVSSVTLDTTTSFIGNILASTSITMNTGATLEGRALAQTGAVTLDTNTFTAATCLTTPTFVEEEEEIVVVPKLPNTGAEPKEAQASLWTIGIATGAFALLTVIIIRKKHVI